MVVASRLLYDITCGPGHDISVGSLGNYKDESVARITSANCTLINTMNGVRAPSRVKISDVSFKNIRGTSTTTLAVKLVCGSGFPCEKVMIGDIDLSYTYYTRVF
ncbi:hypothetical protein POUND7_013129 [Theobroma cacao]